MRILHVAASIAPRQGGPSTAVVQMCRALAREGISTSLFTTNLDGDGCLNPFGRTPVLEAPLYRPVSNGGVEVRHFPTAWPSRFAYSPALFRHLRGTISQFDLVHIHSVYLFTSLAAAWLARNARVPYIVRPHGTFMPHLRHRHRRLKAAYRLLSGQREWDHASAIHYTSEIERSQASDLRLRAPAVVVPLGLELEQFASLPPRGRFRAGHDLEGRTLIVFLGRLAERKGLDLLVSAFGVVAADFPNAHLVIAGPDDRGYSLRVAEMVREAGLTDRTTLPGLVIGNEKLALLADTDLWVLPSYGENFGLAVVEALAAGLPVLVSNRVDISSELASAGAAAVTECTVGSLSSNLRELLSDPARRDQLRHNALTTSRRFSWQARIGALIELYQSILNRESHGGVASSG
jgi:glycosyltransferase involved in cell wall biosynthesis